MTVNQKIRVMRKENGSVKFVPLELLTQMADIFGCSVNDLTGGDSRYTQDDSDRKSIELSDDEQNLLSRYRKLSPKEKNAVMGLCDLLNSDH